MNIADLDINITRSNRKTVSIFIERDGSVSARVPAKLSEAEIEEVIESKAYQIHKQLAEWQQLNDRRVEREYVNGQSFLYLGKNYRLKLVEEKLEQLKLKNGWFLLGKKEAENAKTHFVQFYKQKLENRLERLVPEYAKKMDVAPNEVRVMELKYRWASCSKKGNVNFHWKCAMAPVDVLQYIIVHELAHLIHPNHTKAFWNEVDKTYPNYEKQMEWLRQNGAGMDL